MLGRRHFTEATAALLTIGAATRAPAAAPDLQEDARTAWLFAVPLIAVSATRHALLSAASATDGGENILGASTTLATPASRSVTTPNVDTLYATAFLDLTRGPVHLHVPDVGRRYQSVVVFDLYTNANVVIGERTPGGAAGEYRLIGPDSAPERRNDIAIRTPHAWLLARTLVESESDLPDALEAQARLSLYGPRGRPVPDTASVGDPWPKFFNSALDLLESDPPFYTDGLAALLRLRAASSNRRFERASYTPAQQKAIDAGVADAQAFAAGAGTKTTFIQGWSYPPKDLGHYKDNFELRAMVAISGLGALPVKEAVYLRAEGDGGTSLFHGDGLYRLRLDRPVPVDGFWSLTMYEAEPNGTFYLTPNPIDRYAISDRTPGIVRSSDGTFDIWICRTDPGGDRSANWLPAPASGPFAMTLRAYLPKPSLLDGSYRVPAIEAVAD